MRKKAKAHKCWICNDEGMIIYEKSYNNRLYEMAYRCRCKRGLRSSDRIPVIGDELGEKLAFENYRKSPMYKHDKYLMS